MFKEASDFCVHLKTLERDLRSLHKEVESNFSNLRGILLAPLPRAYEEAQNGVAQACSEGEPKLIGQGVQVDSLMQCSADLKNRLEEEVVKPLKHWYAAYKNIVDRMTKLEQLRLELDSRRRTVETLQLKLDRLRTQVNMQNRDKVEQEADKLLLLLQHKQDKLQRTGVSYREAEQTVFNSLNTLIKDTGVLRDYTGLALQLVQDCYFQAHTSYKTATPMPEYTSTTDLYNQTGGMHYEHMPVIEKVKSERAVMVRQLSERPGVRMGSSPGPRDVGGFDKAAGSGANIYAAAADDAAEHPYDQSGSHSGGGGYGDAPAGSHAPGGGHGVQQGGYGGATQQGQQQHNPYAGAAGNPYTNNYAHSPSGRYGAAAPPAAWQPTNAF